MSTITFLMMLGLSTSLVDVVEANAFLKANAAAHEERISEEDVQTSLLAEVEGTFGEGSASSRVKQLEEILGPIFAALPKNEQGYLGHATVRYALHRLFVQRHGWSMMGVAGRACSPPWMTTMFATTTTTMITTAAAAVTPRLSVT